MLRIPLYILAVLVSVSLVVVAIGYALPKGHVASVEATLTVPPERVFERISDPSRYRGWRKDLTSVEFLSSEPLMWRERSGGDTITYEAVENRPLGRFVVRIADPDLPFGGTWTYELRPEGAGTHLTITERGEVYNPIFRFMSRFVFSQTATMEKYVAGLKASF
jgi:hypothetical protein